MKLLRVKISLASSPTKNIYFMCVTHIIVCDIHLLLLLP